MQVIYYLIFFWIFFEAPQFGHFLSSESSSDPQYAQIILYFLDFSSSIILLSFNDSVTLLFLLSIKSFFTLNLRLFEIISKIEPQTEQVKAVAIYD